jgi:EAL domain-containing protein (putative c-di-GMP-specific phosphodiesterase class I)
VQLARTLGYGTIAEGVENAAQEEGLRAMGCEMAQGYHLGRPLDADAARWLLAARGLAEHAIDGALSA